MDFLSQQRVLFQQTTLQTIRRTAMRKAFAPCYANLFMFSTVLSQSQKTQV